jgi:hypothetical protein
MHDSSRPTTTGTGLVNVCGCGSSGSTLLAHALDRHPRIACGDELFLFCAAPLYRDYARFRRFRHIHRLIGVSGNPYHQGRAVFRRGQAYGLSRGRLWHMATASRSINELAARVRDHVLATTGKPIWAEKTPRNIRVIDRFLGAFPAARVIHIVRDPRDVLLSLHRRGKSLLAAAETWLASVAAITPHQDSGRVLNVRYEDLCRDPARTLAGICAFIGVDFEPDYFFSNAHVSRGLSRFAGHDSWSLDPARGFSAASIGRYRTVDFDWHQVSSLRLTADYAAVLGTPRLRLGQLARANGYDLADIIDDGSGEPFKAFDSRWQLDRLRRRLDRLTGIPDYVPMIEYQRPPGSVGPAGGGRPKPSIMATLND